jgi:hypothetical protein
MKIFLSLGLALSLLFPSILLAETWNSNNFPIDNFSFEEYNPINNTFTDWYYDDLTMDPEVFDQSLMPSLHYTACAHIVENGIVGEEESCYLTTDVYAADDTRKMFLKSCYLVAFVKCSGVSSTTGGGVFAEVYMPGGDVNTYYDSQILTGEHNWCKLIVPFTFPGDPSPDEYHFNINVGLRDATGEVWIDYVQIVQMETTPMVGVCTNLQNPSMDFRPLLFQGWTKNESTNIKITEDQNNHMNGPISAKFYVNVPFPLPIDQTTYLYQNISADTDFRTYYASAFVKTDNLQYSGSLYPGAKLHITYPGLDWYSQSIVGSQKWMKIQGTFDKPAGTGALQLRLETTAKFGSAWFDWVTLKLNPVQNPAFNNWSTSGPPPKLRVWELYNLAGDGTGGYSIYYSHSAPSCGYIDNDNKEYDTALMQYLSDDEHPSPSLREGATYLLTGWIKTVDVEPLSVEPGGEGGALVEVGVIQGVGGDFITLVSSKPLADDKDWQEFSLCFSLPLDYFIDETDDLYSMKNDGLTTFDEFAIRCRLLHASGTAYFDDVNIVELEPTEDLATVVPQPQAYQSFGYFSDPLVSFQEGDGLEPFNVVTIYYTPDGSPDPELGDTYAFSAKNLQQELNRAFYECTGENPSSGYAGWEAVKYNYPIPAGNIKKLDSTVTVLSKPCIILGDPFLDDPNHPTSHLFWNELLKRGIVLPEDISAEGYIMQVEEDMILIAASDSGGEGLTKGAGSFYGTETLLQMLDIEKRGTTPINCPGGVTYLPNKVVAPACYIYDYPDMVWRGQMSFIGNDFDDPVPGDSIDYPEWYIYEDTGFSGDDKYDNDPIYNKKLFAQQMAKFKMNRLSLFSEIFFFLNYPAIDNPQDSPYLYNYEYLCNLFQYCRKLHIEPIPMLGNWNNALLRHNGNCLEYMIFNNDYIEQNNIRPGEGDYQGMPDYYQNYEDYPYPMPQPSWEFEIESQQENPGQIYYFADDRVKVYVGDGIYTYKPTGCYRVCGNDLYEIRVEKRNALNEWELLDEVTHYILNNVGLNDGNTSYYRLSKGGFYGVGDEEKANIEFTTVFSEGTEIRVSYAAPINLSLIWPDWGGGRQEAQLAYWICLSDFDQDLPTDPINDDTPENWVNWDTRDIWYVGLYEMINWLKPRYIDIQNCEMWVMHTDWRCREDRKGPGYSNVERYPGQMRVWEHNAWIYGHEIEYLRQKIADINDDLGSNTQMMLYADMLDSHNGRYAEGRCRWDWYDNNAPDEYHQPDSDDNWVGNANSHIYYQPAMGGMGGWTWDEREEPNGLNPCNYGMMASDYITEKDSIVCREWGYQAGYFDDRDPENVILWQDKFKDRFNDLDRQGFTNFVGDCAGYALALEGGEWGGVRMRCRDVIPVINYYAHLEGDGRVRQLDGSNLNWVEMEEDINKSAEQQIDITLFLEAYNDDSSYGEAHLNTTSGKGCRVGTVQDGIAYIDDIQVKQDGGNIFTDSNLDFETDFDNNQDPLQDWKPSGYIWDSWIQSDEDSHLGNHCCKFKMDKTEYYYVYDDINYTHIERQLIAPFTPLYDYHLDFNVWLKTIKFDALRHLNPKIWIDLLNDYPKKEKVLGLIDTFWWYTGAWWIGGPRNYSSISTSADWMWSGNYPKSPFIKYFYYDPYYLFLGDKMNNPGDRSPPNAPYPKDLEKVLP